MNVSINCIEELCSQLCLAASHESTYEIELVRHFIDYHKLYYQSIDDVERNISVKEFFEFQNNMQEDNIDYNNFCNKEISQKGKIFLEVFKENTFQFMHSFLSSKSLSSDKESRVYYDIINGLEERDYNSFRETFRIYKKQLF